MIPSGDKEWGELDFPVWIHVEHYEDNWEFLRRFVEETGVDKHETPREGFKYCVFSVWFKVTEDGKRHGPYDDKRGDPI